MSRLFSPSCIQPIYVMDDISIAHKCGLISGLMYCSLMTPIFLLVFLRFYYKNYDPLIIKLVVFIFFAMWLVVPFFLKFAYGNMWLGYDQTLKIFIKEGMSKIDAILTMTRLFGDTNVSTIASIPSIPGLLFGKAQNGKGQAAIQSNSSINLSR
jgi:hypothetical protein